MMNQNQTEPRVLVIANECISQSTSNGRTLRNFLAGWPKDALAQFYLHGAAPDTDVCGRFFCCSDGQALRAFLGKPAADGHGDASSGGGRKKNRTAMTMLLREVVWNSKHWASGAFRSWVEAFSPEVILLQAGDCGFLFRLAEELAEKYAAPLVIYNSEGYYFKKFDYFRARGLAHWCYPLFRYQFCRQFRKTMRNASHAVYLCDGLKAAYDAAFSVPSTVLYTASELHPFAERIAGSGFSAAYLGNLGVGRHEPLMEIGRTLHEISDQAVLHVYGRSPTAEIQAALENCPGVRFHGVVSYETVKQVMAQSDLLVHGESFSAFYREDLRFAFSTKIADCLASGRCFLLYAPSEVASVGYLRKKQAAYVATDRNELRKTLEQLLVQPESRHRYREAAIRTAKENHCAKKNAAKFQEILRKTAGMAHEGSADQLCL